MTLPKQKNPGRLLRGWGGIALSALLMVMSALLAPAAFAEKAKLLYAWKQAELPKRFDGENFVPGQPAGFLDSFVVTLWVRPESLNQPWNPLLFTDGAGPSAFHLSLRQDGTPNVAIQNGKDWVHAPASAQVLTGSWHHLAVVCDTRPGGTIRFYIDGTPAGLHPSELGVPADLTGYRLGAWNAWAAESGKNFRGALADVRLYRGLLTDKEIGKIMRETPMDKENKR